jgi:hypothetical protein
MKTKQVIYGKTSTWKWNGPSKKGYAIIEAEHLMKEFKENLRRLAVLIMIVGVGLIIYGIVKGL